MQWSNSRAFRRPSAGTFLWVLLALLPNPLALQAGTGRTVSGTIITSRNEAVMGVSVMLRSLTGEEVTTSDLKGRFWLVAAEEPLVLRIEGKNIEPQEQVFPPGDPTEDLLLEVRFVIPPVHKSLTIVAAPLEPGVDRRNAAVYQKTLFSRDDQIFHSLDAGINTGQHEGGGKSLEIRRFGFNLDHGGIGGGLKVLVDNVQQNQATQGHGQGYLGSLKSLTPELVQELSIVNGPFSAEYGDFSGLGVVHIRF